jgi:hypothetical protein
MIADDIEQLIDLKEELRQAKKSRDGCIAVSGFPKMIEHIVRPELHAAMVDKIKKLETRIAWAKSNINCNYNIEAA